MFEVAVCLAYLLVFEVNVKRDGNIVNLSDSSTSLSLSLVVKKLEDSPLDAPALLHPNTSFPCIAM